MPTKDNIEIERPPLKVPSSGHTNTLPKNYTEVLAVALQTNTVSVPECGKSPIESCIDYPKEQEKQWSDTAVQLFKSDQMTCETTISWAAYHASRQAPIEDLPALRALLPLFYEKSSTPSMIKHGMDLVKQAVDFLNPGQIPVRTAYQPLFALAKYVQLKWPETHGGQSFVVMLGGLHTEMALWKTLGDILEGSGWTTALAESGVASSGTADSYQKVTHLNRTRHAHQVTFLTLRHLMNDAYMLTEEEDGARSFLT
ncbi:hypothetical protein ElyMa_000452400 [Elysia marginata]|uniref:Uncharacterized protein n=1 Tax=Elysia marginata TaxID=1093978 RepID=A0AAV4FQQ9_9GAST|nr:hypothetical protein ElyMa_000452400 [Elysia marginata]